MNKKIIIGLVNGLDKKPKRCYKQKVTDMPITKSAQKAWRQSIKRRAKNADQKKSLKNILKKVRALISQKKSDEAKKILPAVYKALDKAAKAGLIKKNTASRTKSRLAKSLK